MSGPSISELYVYPVKSFRGISLSKSLVGARGLQFDRRWMLVDAGGQFMTQRSDTRLALFQTKLESQGILISREGFGSVFVPFDPLGSPRTVTVWRDSVDALQCSDAADAWLSDVLGANCSLVYMPDSTHRQSHLDFTQPGDAVGFADAFQVLVIGEASLGDLNSRLEAPLPINRFRGNVILSGTTPFEEDTWPKVEIAGIPFRAAKKCGRCSVTATNQDTGEVGVEPLRTLAEYRRDGKNVMFGAYYVPEATGEIAVGDAVVLQPALK